MGVSEEETRSGADVAFLLRMANSTTKTSNPAPHAGETEDTSSESGQALATGAPSRQRDQQEANDPAELDDSMAGNPDRNPGSDDPGQRPLTDNKAGG